MEDNQSKSWKDKIMNKNDSYVFYKNEYERLIKENEQLKAENERLNKKLISEIHQLRKENKKLIDARFKKLYKEARKNINLNKEIHYAHVFNDTIKESEWLKTKDFSLIKSAANYSLMYVLYRILNDSKPKNILELGLGQTSKLTTQYVNYHTDAKLTIMEGDQDWIDNFSEKLPLNDNIDIVHMDTEEFEYDGTLSIRFKDVLEVVGSQKFDLIIIDGPQGFVTVNDVNELFKYSRTNVWQLIPNNLEDDFIILMDDYNREGEQNTFNHIIELLEENNIEFYEYTSRALKNQHAVFTEKYKFISWI